MLKASDVIALVSAVVAALALFISIYAIYVTQQIATTGFQSAQKVKLDTANLLAALRGIMVKSALYTQQDRQIRDDSMSPDYIDIRPEKEAIQTFLDSATAIAYYDFVATRSKRAAEAGKKGEEWRVFFLSLVQLLHTGNTYQAGVQAARIEKMFDSVSDEDIEQMSSGLRDLSGAIKRISEARPHDTLLHVLVDMRGADDPTEEDCEAFVAFLHDQGISDPDLDFLWSAMSGDTNLAEDALKRGARLDTTTGVILSRYKELWPKFEAERKA